MRVCSRRDEFGSAHRADAIVGRDRDRTNVTRREDRRVAILDDDRSDPARRVGDDRTATCSTMSSSSGGGQASAGWQ
jgi:hypothetical protein